MTTDEPVSKDAIIAALERALREKNEEAREAQRIAKESQAQAKKEHAMRLTAEYALEKYQRAHKWDYQDENGKWKRLITIGRIRPVVATAYAKTEDLKVFPDAALRLENALALDLGKQLIALQGAHTTRHNGFTMMTIHVTIGHRRTQP